MNKENFKERITFYCKCGIFLGVEKNDKFISSSKVKTEIDYKTNGIIVRCVRCGAKTVIKK